MVKVNIEGSIRLSEILSKSPNLSEVLESMERDGIPYIILVNGRYTRMDEDPIVDDGSIIKIYTPVSGGI